MKSARRKNVLGAFRGPGAKLAAIKGMNILLVDDLFTMGATPSACLRRALSRAAAAWV